MDTQKVTRVEVINHRNEKGRVYTLGPADDVKVELSLQDDGRTLKVFIDKRPAK
jgi:hypothetical protein